MIKVCKSGISRQFSGIQNGVWSEEVIATRKSNYAATMF